MTLKIKQWSFYGKSGTEAIPAETPGQILQSMKRLSATASEYNDSEPSRELLLMQALEGVHLVYVKDTSTPSR
jgi:hypothetical protein